MVARITEMVGLRKIVAGSVAAALMVTSASPAMAGWGGGFGGGYGGYDGYGERHHHRDHDDAGAIIGAIAVVGIIAAIAAASSKSKRDGRYPTSSNSNQRGNINSENAAVDACASATEQRGGQMASVRDIQNVRSNGDGWDVEGTVEQRSDWRDRTPEKHRFTCSVRYGAVDSVYIDGDAVALR